MHLQAQILLPRASAFIHQNVFSVFVSWFVPRETMAVYFYNSMQGCPTPLWGPKQNFIWGPPIWLVIVTAWFFAQNKSNTTIFTFVCCSFVAYIIPLSVWHVFTFLWFLIVTVANFQEWSGVNLHFHDFTLTYISTINVMRIWRVIRLGVLS